MTGLRARLTKILLEPTGSGIAFEAWRSWHRYGFVVCPASKRRHTCSNHRCRMGADCNGLQALGLRSNCFPLPRKQGPFAVRATDRVSRVQSRSSRASGDAVSTADCRRGPRPPPAAPASPRRSGGAGMPGEVAILLSRRQVRS
jgi:hypothetical protein